MLSQSVHLLFLVISSVCLLAACAWVYRRSPAWGVIVAVGAGIRVVGGVGLVAVSYYRWPILQSLQTGDGFWAIAPDARVYLQLAADAARAPWGSIAANSPSPTYVLALSLWFRAFGATVTNGIVFNVACYVVTVVAIVLVADSGARRLGGLALFCLSFSPALVLTSSQVLKDAFFAMWIVVGCAAIVVVLRDSSASVSAHKARLAAALAIAAVAIAAMAGVRAYFALFVWIAVAAALLGGLCTVAPVRRITFAGFATAVLVVLWCAFAVGAGAYYPYYQELIARTTGINLSLNALTSVGRGHPAPPVDPGALGERLNALRDGFLGSGGATNIVTHRRHGATRTAGDVAVDLATGLGVTFVPITMLKRAALLTFDGGRGLLLATDADTLFIDLSFVAIGVALVRRAARSVHSAGSLIFVAALTIIATLVVAYVVTNFGTLVRLRLLFAVPAWLAPATFRTTT